MLQPLQMIEPFLDLSVPMPDKPVPMLDKPILQSTKSQSSNNPAECPKLLQELLEKHEMLTSLVMDEEPPPPLNSLENCLKLFTSLDVLDEDNKFICDHCTKKKQEVCFDLCSYRNILLISLYVKIV